MTATTDSLVHDELNDARNREDMPPSDDNLLEEWVNHAGARWYVPSRQHRAFSHYKGWWCTNRRGSADQAEALVRHDPKNRQIVELLDEKKARKVTA